MAMAAASPARIFLSPNRHFTKSLLKTHSFHLHLRQSKIPFSSSSHSHVTSLSLLPSYPKPPNFNPFPISPTSQLSIPHNFSNPIFFNLDHSLSCNWNFASRLQSSEDGTIFVRGDDEPEVAVVVLGWLGAKRKHLRRYVELYNEKGFHAVTFVASVLDVLSFDLGKKVEERIKTLSNELVEWLDSNENGRERFLMFHTFSNTGWLAYGAILDNLRERQDMLEKIRGCVVDSGGDPNLDPKVWAAGFTTALLKKNSSATCGSAEIGDGTPLESGINKSDMEEKEPMLIETWMLFTFEKLFTCLLNLPNINQRLTRVITALFKNQPLCPQLYLYSSGDKVIPYQAVESFVKDQKRSGKKVHSFNFGSSPHVDHYRTYPDIYTFQIHNFLKECLVMVGKL